MRPCQTEGGKLALAVHHIGAPGDQLTEGRRERRCPQPRPGVDVSHIQRTHRIDAVRLPAAAFAGQGQHTHLVAAQRQFPGAMSAQRYTTPVHRRGVPVGCQQYFHSIPLFPAPETPQGLSGVLLCSYRTRYTPQFEQAQENFTSRKHLLCKTCRHHAKSPPQPEQICCGGLAVLCFWGLLLCRHLPGGVVGVKQCLGAFAAGGTQIIPVEGVDLGVFVG